MPTFEGAYGVVVISGDIAGVSAACDLADRGHPVKARGHSVVTAESPSGRALLARSDPTTSSRDTRRRRLTLGFHPIVTSLTGDGSWLSHRRRLS